MTTLRAAYRRMTHRTPAEVVGCCRASCKEDCKRPPCPCNLDAYSPQELRTIRVTTAFTTKNSPEEGTR